MKKFKIIAIAIVLVAISIDFWYIKHEVVPKVVPVVLPVQKAKPKVTTTKSYYIGDSQTDGNLSIKLDSTSGATTMAEIPSTETVFNVNITVTNNGTAPFHSPDAFVSESSVYTQVGSNASTGQNSKAYSTPCFSGGDVLIAANSSVTGCVQFLVPKNALVDTYIYNDLKWYL